MALPTLSASQFSSIFQVQSLKFPLGEFVVFHTALVYLDISKFTLCNVPRCTHGASSLNTTDPLSDSHLPAKKPEAHFISSLSA